MMLDMLYAVDLNIPVVAGGGSHIHVHTRVHVHATYMHSLYTNNKLHIRSEHCVPCTHPSIRISRQ